MSIEITARHLNITAELQEHARRRTEALVAEFPKIEFAHVILDVQRHLYVAEVVVQHKGLPQVEAKESTGDMVASIDAAAIKVEKQLRKHREKIVTSHHKV
jgi:putative sigma-54 modulation protein